VPVYTFLIIEEAVDQPCQPRGWGRRWGCFHPRPSSCGHNQQASWVLTTRLPRVSCNARPFWGHITGGQWRGSLRHKLQSKHSFRPTSEAVARCDQPQNSSCCIPSMSMPSLTGLHDNVQGGNTNQHYAQTAYENQASNLGPIKIIPGENNGEQNQQD
jgi:hypothetical protein